MKKVVLKLDFVDEKIKKKAMKKACGVSGVQTVDFNPEDKTLSVSGDIDLLAVADEVRKLRLTVKLVSAGPVEELEKKKEELKDKTLSVSGNKDALDLAVVDKLKKLWFNEIVSVVKELEKKKEHEKEPKKKKEHEKKKEEPKKKKEEPKKKKEEPKKKKEEEPKKKKEPEKKKEEKKEERIRKP